MTRNILGRIIGGLFVVGAIWAAFLVIQENRRHPQTDDAEVFANLIGIAPEVNGRIIRIHVKDNQLVHQGDLLFEIDPEPYKFAEENARSQQAALEAQIKDLQRTISSQRSAVRSASANADRAQARIESIDAAIRSAQANIDQAKSDLARAQADLTYAENNVLRLEPLLAKQFVTVDVVDQARTTRSVREEGVRQARSRVASAEAQLASTIAQQKEAKAAYEQSAAQFDQSEKSVSILEPLLAQRQAREASVKSAAYDLSRCKVIAPFDGRVTNLNVSEGAYARVGQQVFTLIDARTWWVIANFRETEVTRIKPGMRAYVYPMTEPVTKYEATVDSAGFGVIPDSTLVGNMSQGLPDVQRSMNWIHLATRFPVRIRINDPTPDVFRMGASATVTVAGFEDTSK